MARSHPNDPGPGTQHVEVARYFGGDNTAPLSSSSRILSSPFSSPPSILKSLETLGLGIATSGKGHGSVECEHGCGASTPFVARYLSVSGHGDRVVSVSAWKC